MTPQLRRARSSLGPRTQAITAMIARPRLRFPSRSSFMGRALTVPLLALMAICSLLAIPVIRAHSVPCRMAICSRLFCPFRTTCPPSSYRTALLSPAAAVFSLRSPVPRLTGSLILNGARLILTEAVRPTLKWCSTRARAASLTLSMG